MKTLAPATAAKKTAQKLGLKTVAQVGSSSFKNRGLSALLAPKLEPVTKSYVKIAKALPSQLEDREEPKPLLQWPADSLLRETTRNLLAIKNAGVEYESTGDYFNSGDLAYQLQEILRNIQELRRKTLRIREATNS